MCHSRPWHCPEKSACICPGKDSLQKNPSFLTIEQALADYAALIYHIKLKHEAQASPVVAFGGSYGGMLAAWLRAKYPNAVQVMRCSASCKVRSCPQGSAALLVDLGTGSTCSSRELHTHSKEPGLLCQMVCKVPWVACKINPT